MRTHAQLWSRDGATHAARRRPRLKAHPVDTPTVRRSANRRSIAKFLLFSEQMTSRDRRDFHRCLRAVVRIESFPTFAATNSTLWSVCLCRETICILKPAKVPQGCEANRTAQKPWKAGDIPAVGTQRILSLRRPWLSNDLRQEERLVFVLFRVAPEQLPTTRLRSWS